MLTTNDKLIMANLLKAEIVQAKSNRNEMYADADDHYSVDTYWLMRIDELERILNKLTK